MTQANVYHTSDLTQQFSISGTKVYSIFSSFGQKYAIASELASSPNEHLHDNELLLKLYKTTATQASCLASEYVGFSLCLMRVKGEHKSTFGKYIVHKI